MGPPFYSSPDLDTGGGDKYISAVLKAGRNGRPHSKDF